MSKLLRKEEFPLRRFLEKLPRHPRDERTVYGGNLDFHRLVPAVQENYIRAAIDHSDERTQQLKELGKRLDYDYSLFSRLKPCSRRHNLDMLQFWGNYTGKRHLHKIEDGKITMHSSSPVPACFAKPIIKSLSDVFGAQVNNYFTIAYFGPKEKKGGIQSEWHSDTFTVNVCLYGAPMQWDYLDQGEQDAEIHEQSKVTNELGDVHLFNNNLYHRSNTEVPEKGCVSLFMERPPTVGD